MLYFEGIPYVNRIIVASAEYKSPAEREAARCKPGIRVGRFEGRQLLIRSKVPETGSFVLGRGNECLAGRMILFKLSSAVITPKVYRKM